MSGLRSATLHVPGLVLVEHELDVPLDPFAGQASDDATLTVFAREVADPEGRDRPFLVYLQGGPGQEAPRHSRRRVKLSQAELRLLREAVLGADEVTPQPDTELL